MGRFTDILLLVRVHQWYKNLLILLPIIFSGNLLDAGLLRLTVIGFFALCLVSSSGYCINDVADRKKDAVLPLARRQEKALVNRRISSGFAVLLAGLLLIAGVGTALLVSLPFAVLCITLFVLMQAYTLLFKQEFLVDALGLSLNHVIRAVSGAFVASNGWQPAIWVSPWLLACTYLLALFCVIGKRRADAIHAPKSTSALLGYGSTTSAAVLMITTSVLVSLYTAYTFLSVHPWLIISVPFAFYTLMRCYVLIENGSEIPLVPQRFYLDRRLTLGFALWFLTVIVVVYFIGGYA